MGGLYGSMYGARKSADRYQMIGCELLGAELAGVYCMGRDKTGQMVTCSTGKPGAVNAAKGITAFSIITFKFSAPIGDGYTRSCEELRVSNNSGGLPPFTVRTLPTPIPIP